MFLIMEHCIICLAEYWYGIPLCISVLYLHGKPGSHSHLHYEQWKYTVYVHVYFLLWILAWYA